MSYSNKLRYAGGKPYEHEKARLPYPVYEALSQVRPYQRLAQVRWLAYRLEEDCDDHDDVSDVVYRLVFDAADGSLREAVEQFVAKWLIEQASWLIVEWGLAPATVREACEEYGVLEVVDFDAEVADV